MVAGKAKDGYSIHRATWRDLRAIHRLEHAVFSLDAYPYFDLLVLMLLPGIVRLKLLDAGGALVGFAAGGRLPGDRRIWIITLAVDAAHRRQGLGRRLLAACEDALAASAYYLTVRQSNLPAIRLYERCGYEQVRVKRRYYRGGEDGIEMRKDAPRQDAPRREETR